MGNRESAADAAAGETVVSEEQVTYSRRRETVDVHQLHRSALNYRKRIDDAKLDELAASIRRLGVLEPLLVREWEPGAGEYEVIAGERRWRATLRIVDEVPARAELEVIVIDVDDATALEIMVTENTQREDPHPLDECDGFVRLRDDFGRTPEQIAAKISRPVRYVYERLRLERLCVEGRDAMFEGRFGIGVGLALARIASAKLQAKATKELLQQYQHTEVPIEAARRWVRDRYMLRLAQAPFSTTDAELVPSAGACTACPRRTGNDKQGELFGDDVEHGRDDMCTDSPCWEGKREAAWSRLAEEAKSEGVRVATAKESKEILPTSWGAPRDGYVDIDQPDYALTAQKSWRTTLGKKRLAAVGIVLARDTEGKPRYLAKREDIVGAVRAMPSSKDPEALRELADEKKKPTQDERRQREMEAEADLLTETQVVEAVVLAVHEAPKPMPSAFWRALAWALVCMFDETIFEVARRRGLIVANDDGDDIDPTTGEKVDPYEKSDELIYRAIIDMKDTELVGLMAEFLVLSPPSYGHARRMEPKSMILDALQIDEAAIRRQVLKQIKAEARAKEKAVAKSPKRPKSRAELDAEEAEAKREQMEDAYAE